MQNPHHAIIVADWVKLHKAEIEVFFLPSYSPEYNPDEYLNGNLKREMAKKEYATTKKQLESNARGIMKTLQNDRGHIRRLFHAKPVRYTEQPRLCLVAEQYSYDDRHVIGVSDGVRDYNRVRRQLES
jgi:hypothetical protein